MRFQSVVSCIFLVLSLVTAELIAPSSTWENVEYRRNIDLTKSYVKEIHELKIKNVLQEPSQIYYFSIPSELKSAIAALIPTVSNSGSRKALITSEVKEEADGLTFFKIQLPFPIAPKATFEFQIALTIIEEIFPLPEEVSELSDEQSLVFSTNKLPISIYPTDEYVLKFSGFQKTVDELPITGISEELNLKYLGKAEKGLLVYGPYDLSKEPPLTNLPMSLLYIRKTPLLKVNSLKRDIWISHWSELLQVEEHYQLTNPGVRLKNGFNRVEYMQKKLTHKLNPAINSIEVPILDDETTDIYYTDLVGNVSTSVIMENSLLLKPRYPIFGGWNYNFTIGWTNPLSKYVHSLKNEADHQILRVPILSGPRDCTYSELNLNVYLPAGSEILEVETPLGTQDYQITKHYSYLDTLEGHTKLSLTFSNLVDDMRNINLIVKYSYTSAAAFAQVVSISIYFFIALISFVAIKFIDIRINTRK